MLDVFHFGVSIVKYFRLRLRVIKVGIRDSVLIILCLQEQKTLTNGKKISTTVELLITIVFYCIVLYCIVLYCIVLYCIVLHCNDHICINLLVPRYTKNTGNPGRFVLSPYTCIAR